MENVADPPDAPTLKRPGSAERLATLRHLLWGRRFHLEMGGDTLLARPARVDVEPLRITCEPWPPDRDALWFMVDGHAFEAAWALDHIETAAGLLGGRLLSMARQAADA